MLSKRRHEDDPGGIQRVSGRGSDSPLLSCVAERCPLLRETLRSQGRRVNSRALDLMNAATALEHGLTLVTRNVDDYKDIPGLSLYA